MNMNISNVVNFISDLNSEKIIYERASDQTNTDSIYVNCTITQMSKTHVARTATCELMSIK